MIIIHSLLYLVNTNNKRLTFYVTCGNMAITQDPKLINNESAPGILPQFGLSCK